MLQLDAHSLFKDNMNQILKWMLSKFTSARYIMSILVIATLCLTVFKCFELLTISIKGGDEKLLSLAEKIVMYVLGSFTAVVSSVVALYFARTDRSGERENKGEDKNDKNN